MKNGNSTEISLVLSALVFLNLSGSPAIAATIDYVGAKPSGTVARTNCNGDDPKDDEFLDQFFRMREKSISKNDIPKFFPYETFDTTPSRFPGLVAIDSRGSFGVPPLKWSTDWDMTIPLFGGPEDGWKAREAGRHCFEASAG